MEITYNTKEIDLSFLSAEQKIGKRATHFQPCRRTISIGLYRSCFDADNGGIQIDRRKINLWIPEHIAIEFFGRLYLFFVLPGDVGESTGLFYSWLPNCQHSGEVCVGEYGKQAFWWTDFYITMNEAWAGHIYLKEICFNYDAKTPTNPLDLYSEWATWDLDKVRSNVEKYPFGKTLKGFMRT